MARPERIELEVPPAGQLGRPEHVFRLRDKTVQVSGVFTGALQLEGSIDGFAFAPVSSPITAPGFVTVRLAIAYLRVHTLELTAGAAAAMVAGFDFRSM